MICSDEFVWVGFVCYVWGKLGGGGKGDGVFFAADTMMLTCLLVCVDESDRSGAGKHVMFGAGYKDIGYRIREMGYFFNAALTGLFVPAPACALMTSAFWMGSSHPALTRNSHAGAFTL